MRLDRSTVTRLLEAWSLGDPEALVRLIPHVLDELRTIAASLLAREPVGITLQPTALVNELYLRLVKRRSVRWKNSEQFFGEMATMIRRVLVDHARERRAVKRGGGLPNVPLGEDHDPIAGKEEELLALDDALSSLAQFDPRLSQVVHLRYFVGLAAEEIAAILGVSTKTVNRDWQKAKIWLYQQMTASPAQRS